MIVKAAVEIEEARGGAGGEPGRARQRDVQERMLVAVATPFLEHLERARQRRGGVPVEVLVHPVADEARRARRVTFIPDDPPGPCHHAPVVAWDQRLRTQEGGRGARVVCRQGVTRRQRGRRLPLYGQGVSRDTLPPVRETQPRQGRARQPDPQAIALLERESGAG